MASGLNLPDHLGCLRLTHGIWDDFGHYVTGDTWSTVASNSGTIADADVVGGRITLAASDCTAGDNDETYLKSTQEIFLFADNKPLEWGCRLQYAEANTDDANIWAGLMSAIAADCMVDNGAGPKTSGSHFGFWKGDGDTNWHAHHSLGSTQESTELTAANSKDGVAHAAGGSAFIEMYGEFIPYDTGRDLAILNFYITDATTGGVKRLVFSEPTFDYTSATEMNFGFGVKNGDTNGEELVLDWAYCFQKR